MEAFAAIGLVSNVIGFIDSGWKLCGLIKECSAAAGAPAEVIALSSHLELVLETAKEMDESRRAKLDHEKLALKICSDEAEELRLFLERLKVVPDKTSSSRTFKWKRSSLEKGWKAFKTLRGREKLEKFRTSLDWIMGLITMQQQARLEVTALNVEGQTTVLVKNSEEVLKGLKELQLLSDQSLGDISAIKSNPVTIVPFAPNPFFLGRHDIITTIDQHFAREDKISSAKIKKAALCGLGGIGKSQIALKYAYRQRELLPETSIFWVQASNISRFEKSYASMAEVFQLSGRNDPNVDVLQLVRNWLEGQYQLPWLMIIDNADDAHIFDKTENGKSALEYLPQIGKGSILYTSRNRDVSLDLVGDEHIITVSPLCAVEARLLFGESTRLTSTQDEQDALLTELGHLPLAIKQAASFMTKRHKTISQYLKLFRDSEQSTIALLNHMFVDTEAASSVSTAWLISFKFIQAENPQAARLLFLMSLMDRDSIPVSLLNPIFGSAVAFAEAIGLLEAFSFISPDETVKSYDMHRLVQIVTRGWLGDQGDELTREISLQALRLVSSQFPDGVFENWAECARYLPHAESVLSRSLDVSTRSDTLARARLLSHVAWYLKGRGNYVAAQTKLEDARNLYEQVGEAESVEALRAKRRIAAVVNQLGHTDAAIHILRETRESQTKVLGLEHLETLETSDALAATLSNTLFPKYLQESESLGRDTLHLRESSLPQDHPEILTSLHTLGWALFRLGKSDEAAMYLEKCLTKRNIVLGEHHPETSATATELAIVLLSLKPPDSVRAEYLIRHSVNVTSILCGKEHPSTIITYHNMSTLLRVLGKYEESETLQREQLALSYRILGKNHPTTLWCIISLSQALSEQRNYDLVRELVEAELEKRQELVEKSVLDVLIMMEILGNTYVELGQYALADSMFQAVIAGRSQVLGDDDASTLRALHYLGRLRWKEGKYAEAETILIKLLHQRAAILGKTHEETLLTATVLGHSFYSQQKYAEAEIMFQQVLGVKEQSLPLTDESVLAIRDNLEAALAEQQKYAEWESHCRRTLEIRQELAPDGYHTLRALSNLACVLDRQGKEESQVVFNSIMLKIQSLPANFMDDKTYADNMSAEEAAAFRAFQSKEDDSTGEGGTTMETSFDENS
ncbi:TPR-like protein [Stipitochalara longipes BDJ]|nr:TPR-like protein [Stipitochalara longipes BDJ]